MKDDLIRVSRDAFQPRAIAPEWLNRERQHAGSLYRSETKDRINFRYDFPVQPRSQFFLGTFKKGWFPPGPVCGTPAALGGFSFSTMATLCTTAAASSL